MNSYSYRNDPMFLRNQFETHGKFELPYIRKQVFEFDRIELIALSETKTNDSPENCRKIVHGFLDDYRINRYYNYPERYRAKLTQYRALISPDYSTWQEMNTWRGLEAVSHNRWVGKYWQEVWRMPVIPSVTWGSPVSYEYCFDGIERCCWVAISVVGTKRYRRAFIHGYDAMLEHISPDGIICLGMPYEEMRGNILSVPYKYPRHISSRQLCLPFIEYSIHTEIVR